MAYIKASSSYEIGKWVVTTKEHTSLCGTFTKGSEVKITSLDPIRGYSIEDKEGNEMIEIGWVV